jgi:hypothetical protein
VLRPQPRRRQRAHLRVRAQVGCGGRAKWPPLSYNSPSPHPHTPRRYTDRDGVVYRTAVTRVTVASESPSYVVRSGFTVTSTRRSDLCVGGGGRKTEGGEGGHAGRWQRMKHTEKGRGHTTHTPPQRRKAGGARRAQPQLLPTRVQPRRATRRSRPARRIELHRSNCAQKVGTYGHEPSTSKRAMLLREGGARNTRPAHTHSVGSAAHQWGAGGGGRHRRGPDPDPQTRAL